MRLSEILLQTVRFIDGNWWNGREPVLVDHPSSGRQIEHQQISEHAYDEFPSLSDAVHSADLTRDAEKIRRNELEERLIANIPDENGVRVIEYNPTGNSYFASRCQREHPRVRIERWDSLPRQEGLARKHPVRRGVQKERREAGEERSRRGDSPFLSSHCVSGIYIGLYADPIVAKILIDKAIQNGVEAVVFGLKPVTNRYVGRAPICNDLPVERERYRSAMEKVEELDNIENPSHDLLRDALTQMIALDLIFHLQKNGFKIPEKRVLLERDHTRRYAEPEQLVVGYRTFNLVQPVPAGKLTPV